MRGLFRASDGYSLELKQKKNKYIYMKIYRQQCLYFVCAGVKANAVRTRREVLRTDAGRLPLRDIAS